MTVQAPVSATAAQTSGRPAAGGEAKAAAAATDFETFLSLLTAQMRNQDPLKPLDSTEFVAQLASFSSVEQQIRSNERLDSILEALTGGGGAGLAEWIGKDVRSSAPAVFDGTPLEVWTDPASGAERALLVVRNGEGDEVARLAASPNAQQLVWAGETASGGAPEGSYSFEVQYLSDDELIETVEGTSFSRVKELRLGADEPMLLLESGAEVGADGVIAVRSPAGD